MMHKKKIAPLVSALALALSGCVGTMSYPGIEPLSFKPSGMSPNGAVRVDSLTPTFKWKQPVEDIMTHMDIAVGSSVLTVCQASFIITKKDLSAVSTP